MKIDGESPESIISDISGVGEKVAEDLVNLLEEIHRIDVQDGAENYYDSTSAYSLVPIEPDWYSRLWEEFCYKVKHKSRYFSRDMSENLTDIFHDIETYVSSDGSHALREIKTDDPRNTIYRARRIDNYEMLKRIEENPSKRTGTTTRSHDTIGENEFCRDTCFLWFIR